MAQGGRGSSIILDHQEWQRGNKKKRWTADEEVIEKLSKKERMKSDVPVMPARFKLPENKDLFATWESFIEAAPWLVEADTLKCIMLCYMWRRYWADPEKTGKKLEYNLRTLGGELGMDPLSRTRMRRDNIPRDKKFKKHTDSRANGKEPFKESRKEFEKNGHDRGNKFAEFT